MAWTGPQHAEARRDKRLRAVSLYGGKCAWCPENNPACLDFDHVQNDGGAQRKRSKGRILTEILKEYNPKRFMLLCARCHRLRHSGKGPPPTQAERLMEAAKMLEDMRTMQLLDQLMGGGLQVWRR